MIDAQSVKTSPSIPAASQGIDAGPKILGRKRSISPTRSACCWPCWPSRSARPAPGAPRPGGSSVSGASLQADLANAQACNTRLATRVQQLEKRLSQALGAQARQESGLGSPPDIGELQCRIARLEQQSAELTTALDEAARSDLEAARAADRDLTRALNQCV
ncbi:hypothetical protein ACWGII_41660 [Streptomyces sp. NPDC054855]